MQKQSKSKIVSSENKAQILIQEAVFFEKFSELLRADVPLLRALEIAATSILDQALRLAFSKIKLQLERGQSVTDAFKEYPDYVSFFHLAIIESGEKDGHLEEGFYRAAESMRNEAESLELSSLSSEPNRLFPKSSLLSKSFGSTAEQLSEVSTELSKISSHLASVSQKLSLLSKHSKSSKHTKAKHKH